MATYLELCNLVLNQLNDIVLDTTTFANARGFHASVKDAVNFAIRDINQSEIEWPFAYNSTSQVLVAETNSYAFPDTIQRVDWQSFHLEADDALNINAAHLNAMPYDDWLHMRRAHDENNNTGIRIPEAIFKLPNEYFGVTPIPDRAYTISYDYYGFSETLSAYDDTPDIPDRFRWVIYQGSMYYAYMFRDNFESADKAEERFEKGIKHMRTLLINKYEHVSDTRTGYGANRYFRAGSGL